MMPKKIYQKREKAIRNEEYELKFNKKSGQERKRAAKKARRDRIRQREDRWLEAMGLKDTN